MRLLIAIPEAQVVDAPSLLRLVRMAPTCDVEASEEGASYVARFDDFLTSVEIVARLIEETWDLRGIHITLDERRIASRVNFYIALLCYAESLKTQDVEAHCRRQAMKVGSDAGCAQRSCVTHCQFICSRCVGVSRHRDAPPVTMQLRELARHAEVDWCPNLALPSV